MIENSKFGEMMIENLIIYLDIPHDISSVHNWLVVWNMCFFPYIVNHNPNCRTPSFFRGVGWNHQPDIIPYYSHINADVSHIIPYYFHIPQILYLYYKCS